MIPKNSTILFQGDSITDCGRNRDAAGTPNDLCGLGQGYAMMAAAQLLSTRPADGLRVFNRGISGNRVVDLYAQNAKTCHLLNLAARRLWLPSQA
jgi:hypothetical protein